MDSLLRRTIPLCLLVLLGILACADIGASNPFDPATPAAQQAPGTVLGRLALPTGFAATEAEGIKVRLETGTPPERTQQEVVSGPGGAFTFDGVPVGAYNLAVAADVFYSDAHPVDVGIGARIDVGVLQLKARGGSAIEGTARLAGAPVGDHRGIRIEAIGTPFTTETEADGRYHLDVSPGQFDLLISFPDYASATVPGVSVAAGQVTSLSETVVLTGAPGSLHGTVALQPGYDDPIRLAGARVELRDGNEGAAAIILAQVAPDAAGRFEFAGLQPGFYRLTARAEGFFAPEITAQLPAGRDVDAGQLLLIAQVGGQTSSAIEGMALLQGAAADGNGGIRVESQGSPFSVQTTSDGRFHLTVPATRHDLVFSFPGYATVVLPGVRVEAGATVVLPDPVVLAGQPGTVRGSVSLEDGFGVAGDLAAVDLALFAGDAEAPARQGNPDATGVFSLDGLPAGSYRLTASLDLYETETRLLDVPVGGTVDVPEISLRSRPADGTLTGSAHVQGGAVGTHGGSRVEVIGTPWWTETTADGQWRLTVPARAGDYTLEVSRPGYQTVAVTTPSPEGGGTLAVDDVLLVGQPGRIRGVLALPAGYPHLEILPTAVVALLPAGGGDALQQQSPTPDGAFVFDAVAAGAYRVEASLDGFFPGRIDVELAVGGEASVRLSLEPLPTDGTVRGRALVQGANACLAECADPCGLAPLDPAVPADRACLDCLADPVAARSGGIRVEVAGTPFATDTTGAGCYSLALPAAAQPYTLRLARAGYDSASVEVGPLAAGGELRAPDVVLAGLPGRVVGVLTIEDVAGVGGGIDAAALLPEVVLQLIPAGGGAADARVATPAADGRFAFEAVDPGSYGLSATLAGFLPQYAVVDVSLGGTVNLGILPLTPDFRGVAPSYIAGVAHLAGADDHGGIRVETVGFPFTAVTGSTGQFQLQVLGGRSFDLQFSHPGYATDTTHARGIAVREGGVTALPATVVLDLLPASVAGRLLRETPDGSTVPAADATLSLLAGGVLSATGTTTAGGDFAFGAVAGGLYALRAELDAYTPTTTLVALTGGEVLDTGTLVLGLRRGTLAGHVSRADRGLSGGIAVVAEGAPEDPLVAGVHRVTVTEPPDDTFTLSGLAPGVYRVTAVAADHLTPAPTDVTVAPDTTASFEASLSPRLHRLHTPPVSPAQVTVTFERDPDLLYAQVWLDADAPPADAPFARLDGPAEDQRTLNLPTEGEHVVYARLANEAAVDADPANDLFAAISPVLSAPVVRDTVPPRVVSLQVGDGSGFVNTLSPELRVECADAQSGPSGLRLTVTADGAVVSPESAYQTRLSPNLGGADGPHVVTATCRDAAGLTGQSDPVTVVVDRQAPVVTRFALGAGGQNELVATPFVEVSFTIADAVSGLAGIAVAEGNLDCAAASYERPVVAADGQGRLSFVLADAQGAHTLRLCARDRAGNVTGPRASDNTVTLDSVNPSIPTLGLAGGAATIQSPFGVALATQVPDDATDYILRVRGDVPGGERTYAWADLRNATIDLTPGDGLKTLRAQAIDPAGNASDVAYASVTVDLTPPTVMGLVVGDGSGYIRTASPDISLRCVDDFTPAGDLVLTLRVDNVAVYPPGAYTESVAPNFGGNDGNRSVTVTCTDASGRSGTSAAEVVVLDRLAPTIAGFTINSGVENAATRTPNITAKLQVGNVPVVTDATSGVEGISLTESQVPCADAAYGPVAPAIGFTLSAGDGPRQLFLCARDRAGNVTAPSPSNHVILDTVAPVAPTFALAGGAAYTNTVGVARTLLNVEAGASFFLTGDLTAAQLGAQAAVPAQLTLSAVDGLKTVGVQVLDAAGNTSPVVTDTITLDTSAPAAGVVTLADGQAKVNSQVLPYAISSVLADAMAVWELTPDTGDCRPSAPACGAAAFGPFAPSGTLTLSAATGLKRVCWKFCDLAGNGSAVIAAGATVTLGTYLARPRPMLTDVQPRSFVALTNEAGVEPRYPLTISGSGIPFDAQAQVGDFLLPCTPQGALDCRADVAGSCAASCRVSLPSELNRVPGTYFVRLQTPTPVLDGLGSSVATISFTILGPQPQIAGLSTRGIVQDVDAHGTPVSQTLTLDVAARNLVDNVQFRLGHNFATVQALNRSAADPLAATPRLTVTTAGLFPSDLQDEYLVAVNGPPGGGEALAPFGINPRIAPCDSVGTCLSNLRWTRARTPNGRAVFQGFDSVGDKRWAGVAWRGGTAAEIRGPQVGQGAEPLLARVLGQGMEGAIPMPLAEGATVRLEDAVGTEPGVVLAAARGARGTGAFYPPFLIAQLRQPTAAAVADFDENGWPDIAVADAGSASVVLIPANGAAGWQAPVRVDIGDLPWSVAAADVNGDGAADLVVGLETGPVVAPGNGDGTFGDPVPVAANAGDPVHFLLVADVNRDGAPDLFALEGAPGGNGRVQLWFGRGDGRFDAGPSYNATVPDNPMAPMALGDLDGDGRLDLVTVGTGNGNGLRVRRGRAPPALAFGAENEATLLADPDVVTAVAIGHVNLDGALDLVTNGKLGASSEVVVRRNDGAGGFPVRIATALPADSPTVALADVDGDGILDVLAGVVLIGMGDGNYRTVPGTTVLPGIVADLNRDAAPDVVAFNYDLGYWGLRPQYGQSAGSAGLLTTVATQGIPFESAFSDLNRDGNLDLLVLSLGSGVEVYLGDGHGAFTRSGTAFVGASACGMVVGEFTGDGVPDVAVGSRTSGIAAFVLPGNGAGGFNAPIAVRDAGYVGFANMPNCDIALADLSEFRSGPHDLVVLSNGRVGLERAVGDGTFRVLGSFAVQPAANVLAVGDFNLDGLPSNIATGDPTAATASIDVWTGNVDVGRGYRLGPTLEGVSPADLAAVVLDDPRAPQTLVYTDPVRHTVNLVQGGGQLSVAASLPMGDGPTAIAAGDLNGDDHPDLVTANTVSGDVSLRVGFGGTSFGSPFSFTPTADRTALLRGLALGDVNNDGVLDIATVVRHGDNTGDIAIWQRPTPRYWAQELTDMPSAAVALEPAPPAPTIHQAAQWIEWLAVRIRIEGTNLQNLSLELRSPRGEHIALDNGALWANKTVWQASYPTTPAVGDLTTAYGWQPEGDWTLAITDRGAQATLRDFAIVDRGTYVHRPLPADCVERKRGSHRYLYCSNPRTWAQAHAFCNLQGADLVNIGDRAESDWVLGNIQGGLYRDYWIGLSDVAAEGTFVWPDGTVPAFTAWGAGEPSASNVDDDCAEIMTPGMLWNDIQCINGRATICEE